MTKHETNFYNIVKKKTQINKNINAKISLVIIFS